MSKKKYFIVSTLLLPFLVHAHLGYSDNYSAGTETKKKVEVDKLKKEYWAQQAGGEVVQDRVYSKASRFELGVFGGLFNTDPFLDVMTAGLSVGFHFSELYSFHLLGWKAWTSGSSALTTLETTSTRTTANTNYPQAYLGAEGRASIVYGKLSLLGKMILYYDLYVNLGVGRLSTESGDYISPFAGIGQQIYLSRTISLKLDFKEMWFKENVLEKANSANKGKIATTRTNLSNTISLGLAFLF
jgi:outer membrane beta-barrel protein